MPKITKILRITQSWDSNPDFHYAAFLKVDFFLKKVLFVYFIEREGERACTSRVCVWGGERQMERRRERISRRLLTERRARSRDPEIMT